MVPGAANPQALNRYAYVLNNPLRYTDPTGRLPEASVSGEPVPYEPPPLPPYVLALINAGNELLGRVPGNAGVSLQGPKSGQKEWNLAEFRGPIIYVRVQAKLAGMVATDRPNQLIYAEPSRLKFEFPVGKCGKYYRLP